MKTRLYTIKLPSDAYEALEQIAEKQQRNVADVVRTALEDYARKEDKTVSFKVQHGGWRGGKKDTVQP